MRTGATLRPGQKGTRALMETYGDRLVCVRFRYDPDGRRHLKTAEIVVEEVPWMYSAPFGSRYGRRVNIAVGYEERDLRERVKRAGARWNPDTRLWTLSLGQARLMGLTGRIVPDASTPGSLASTGRSTDTRTGMHK